jgi:hypothetical protein
MLPHAANSTRTPSMRIRNSLQQVAGAGLERPANSTANSAVSEEGRAKSDVNDAELRRIAGEILRRLSADQCRRLAALLTADDADVGAVDAE